MRRRLSAERVAPYVHASGGDLRAGLALYEWNVEVSAAFWATLGQVEVVLRNALHEQLAAHHLVEHGEPRWYLDPARILDVRAREDVAAARARATRNGRPELPGGVVAELTFGFWRYLLASRYERTLWLPALRPAFPHHRGMRRDVEAAARDLHLLRNRIAHHEPVHAMDLERHRRTADTLVGWICPVSRAWIARRCRVEEVLDQRPGVAP